MIAILDFGGQYVWNIRRCFLEQGFKAEIYPFETLLEKLKEDGVKGIVISGGPYSVYDETSPKLDEKIISLDIPILGICYGHQLLAKLLGGTVEKSEKGEFGFTEFYLSEKDEIFEGWDEKEICWMSHRDIVASLPNHVKVLGFTKIDSRKVIAAFRYKKIFGVQFHPEVSHTPKGYILLKNFGRFVSGERIEWDVESFINKTIHKIRETVKEKAIIAVSGGVDSTTLAFLASKALGKNLVCVHIDNGLMRENESRNVVENLKNLGLNVVFVDAKKRFYDLLKGIVDPDEKRKVIGETFIRVFEEVAREQKAKWLFQGTIAPDVIESTRGHSKLKKGKHSGLIKIHHNVGGLPEKMELKVIEPFRKFFKYQIRKISRCLNLPKDVYERQPFPGPGLACRITSDVTEEKVKLLQKITSIVEKALRKFNPSQYFAILTSNNLDVFEENVVKKFLDCETYILKDLSIGVKGDERTTGYSLIIFQKSLEKLKEKQFIELLKLQNELTGTLEEICRVCIGISKRNKGKYGIIIRSVNTLDFMTAIPTKIDFDFLKELAEKILDQFDDISFVSYEITTKPAATIEYI